MTQGDIKGVNGSKTPQKLPQIGAQQARNMVQAAEVGVLVVTVPSARNACLRLSDRGYMLRLPNAPPKTDWYVLTQKGRAAVRLMKGNADGQAS